MPLNSRLQTGLTLVSLVSLALATGCSCNEERRNPITNLPDGRCGDSALQYTEECDIGADYSCGAGKACVAAGLPLQCTCQPLGSGGSSGASGSGGSSGAGATGGNQTGGTGSGATGGTGGGGATGGSGGTGTGATGGTGTGGAGGTGGTGGATGIPTGVHALPGGRRGPEGLFLAPLGWAGGPPWLLIGLAENVVLINPLTGALSPHTFYSVDRIYMPIGIRVNPDVLYLAGSQGWATSWYEDSQSAFGLMQISGSSRNHTDVFPIGGQGVTQGFVAVNNTDGTFRLARWNDTSDNFDEIVMNGTSGTGVSAKAGVSAYVHQAAGPVLVATDGAPGDLLVQNNFASPFTAPARIGELGNAPRRIRCLPPICAVSNHDSDSLTIVTWDGSSLTPAIVSTPIPVGDGPVGIDLIASGSNVAVVSTGFNDSTYSITVVSPAGAAVSNTKTAAPTGCTAPGHAIWINDAGGRKVAMTCNTSDNWAVVAAP
jgi:hypothetical protein